LARSTAKAITLAALTTIVGFGSLMISSHRGIYSLGLLVALGVGSILIASLTTLPSLLAILGKVASGPTAASRAYRQSVIAPISERMHT
jgi:predicted RND superfamily exporter protein